MGKEKHDWKEIFQAMVHCEITKARDALNRARDGLHFIFQPEKGDTYSCDQLGKAIAFATRAYVMAKLQKYPPDGTCTADQLSAVFMREVNRAISEDESRQEADKLMAKD